MTRTNLYTGAARWALLFGLAALPLAGCNQSNPSSASSASSAPSSALPLVASGAPVAPAPTAEALPPAPPVPLGHLSDRRQDYAFADQAYALNNAFGDAPPDYGFDYNGTQPWVWRSDNNAMRVAEPLPDGGDRYYYYEPGSDYPYLVRDPSYTYGYDDGQLVVIYDHQGHVVPESEYEGRRDYASRFYARGRDLYANAQQQQHQPVAQPNWVARRQQYAAEQQAWASYQADDSDWRAYHDSHQQQEQDQWDGERARRESEAAQFAQSINDQQDATRDMEAAQRAQARAQAASSAPGGQHSGGPSGPAPAASPQPAFVAPNQPAPPNPQPSFHQGQSYGAAGGAPAGQGDRHEHHSDANLAAPGSGSERATAPNGQPSFHAGESAGAAGGGPGEQGQHRDHHSEGAPAASTTPPSVHPAGAEVAPGRGPGEQGQHHDHQDTNPGVQAEVHHEASPSGAPEMHPAGAGEQHHATPGANPAPAAAHPEHKPKPDGGFDRNNPAFQIPNH